MAVIFHITTEAEWNEANKKGYYEAASLKDEGFIHCCQEEQVQDVLRRYFAGKENLLKLEIETDKLTSPFYYEWSPSVADTFPHIYGVINLEAVKKVQVVTV
jgi:uncharacterized protein (DUF952 family)